MYDGDKKDKTAVKRLSPTSPKRKINRDMTAINCLIHPHLRINNLILLLAMN